MPNLTFCGETYAVNHAVKGADYIHGYDANGVCIVAFEGVADLTAIGYDGTFMAPGDCAEEACNKVVYCGGKLKTLGGGAVSVPRANLAQDALYSPIVVKTFNFELAIDEVGATYSLVPPASGDGKITATLTEDVAASLGLGAIFAFFLVQGNEFTITFNNVRIAINGESSFIGGIGKTVSVKSSNKFSTVAIQSVFKNDVYGDVWAVAGDVEVVA